MKEPSMRQARGTLGLILGLALGVRLMALDQPIVENYVGRQIPTAMVARNLDRGSGFLRPELDVSPRPNLFLVEPPIYAETVLVIERVTGLELEAAGRLTSALGILLGAWGLCGLVARREGRLVALVATTAFVCVPLTIRYGRAFQPDALMIGCVVAGVRGWDEYEHGGRARWLAVAFVGLASGLALKIVSAYVLVPILLGVIRDRKPWKLGLLAATILPALVWYAHAARVLSDEVGSHASGDNRAIWTSVLAGSALTKLETYGNIVRFLGIRSFTPLGPILALLGFVPGFSRRAEGISIGPADSRLWLVWAGSALAAMAVVAAKLHHEYYWLSLAPVMAVGIARALVALLERWGAWTGSLASAAFVGLCIVCSASTWTTPEEWRSLPEAACLVRSHTPPAALIVAPEALIFASDRRGCRVEYTALAARRAAGEWRNTRSNSVDGPIALVEFYRLHGADFFVDVVPAKIDPRRLALHEAVRRRYNVVVDLPGVVIASLKVPNEVVAHGQAFPTD